MPIQAHYESMEEPIQALASPENVRPWWTSLTVPDAKTRMAAAARAVA